MTAPMAVRLAWGRLHLGRPTGHGYHAVCGRTLACTDEVDDLVVYWGRDVAKAWKLEETCRDCERKVQRALRHRAPTRHPHHWGR